MKGRFDRLNLQLNETAFLAPGERFEIAILFIPGAPQLFQGELIVELCEGGCAVSVQLQGFGVLDPLSCSPALLGQVPVQGCGDGVSVCVSAVDDNVIVRAAELRPPGTDFQLLDFRQFTLGPDDAQDIAVRFCPVFEGPVQASLQLATTSAGISRTFVASDLFAEGIRSAECRLRVEPEVDFGGVVPMTEATSRIQVENIGELPCGITILGIEGGQGAFRMVNPLPGRQLLVPIGQIVELEVAFLPAAFQTYEGNLQFETNDPANPRGQIRLVGVGLTDRTYTVTRRTTGPFTPLQGQRLVWQQGNADDGYTDVTIPFNFEFLGRSTRIVRVSTNGFITFANRGGGEFQNQVLPDSSLPNALVALWWDDLDPGRPVAPGLVTTRTSNVNGQSIFHIAYIQVAAHVGPVERISGEIRLYAGTNVIELHYGSYVDTPSVALFSASAGWEGYNGIRGADLLGCRSRCAGSDWPASTEITLTPAVP